MDQDPQDRQRSRESTLAVALVVLVGGIILFFLYFISFGVVGNVLIGAGIIVVVGAFHYLVGQSTPEEVARNGRRSSERLRRTQTAKKTPADAIQDLSRSQGIKE